jgi:hypothetical protein
MERQHLVGLPAGSRCPIFMHHFTAFNASVVDIRPYCPLCHQDYTISDVFRTIFARPLFYTPPRPLNLEQQKKILLEIIPLGLSPEFSFGL